MITRKMYTWFLVGIASFLSVPSIFSAVFVVTNTNNQGPGSLREAIENLNAFGGVSNEIIVSLIDGKITVVLLSELPTVTKQVNLDGFDQVSGQPIVIDVNNVASHGLRISGASASNSVITNITIKDVQSSGSVTRAMGIGIEDFANSCSIINCNIHNVLALESGTLAAGIFVDRLVENAGPIVNNTIFHVQASGERNSSSGIIVSTEIKGDCSGNIVSDITTGQASASGSARGIQLFSLLGSCQENIIKDIHSGDALVGSSGEAEGILIGSGMSGDCTDNIIENVTSGSAITSSGDVLGIEFFESIAGSVQRNSLSDLASGSADDSGNVVGINTSESIGGSCVQNRLSYFSSGDATKDSGQIDGIRVDGTVGLVAHNTIEHCTSGSSADLSGEIKGIDLQNGTVRCSYNVIRFLTSGNAPSSGNIEAIEFDGVFVGDCNNNLIHDLVVMSSTNDSPDIVAIQAEDDFVGNILSNTIYNLNSQGTTIGIDLQGETQSELIACNNIYDLTGESASGITLILSTGVTIANNVITNLHASTGNALGLGGLLNSSLIIKNKVANIISDAGSGIGIQLKDPSLGNDILTNSIFDITTKAIEIDSQADVQELTLTAVRCSVGNRIGVTGVLIPEATLAGRTFLIQFFVSDSNTPEQAKTFIGECEHDSSIGSSFDCSFVVQAPTQFGQFITATATALLQGTEENINTSEVSNALFACETSGGVCTIATCPTEPTPPSIDPCLLVGICADIDLL